MDTYPYPDKDFMSDWTCAVMTEYPKFNIVGEEWSVNPAIVSFWQKDKLNHNGYISCLPSLMDFPLQFAMADALNDEKENWNSGLIKMYEMLANDFLYSHPNDLVVFPDNHDMDRFFTQVNQDIDLFKMGLVYIACIRGIPQIYYGTEIAMDNSEMPGDHGTIRADFPGGWENDQKNAFTNIGLSAEEIDIKNFTKTLFNWRKNAQPIHYGNLIQFAPENGIYAFVREYKGKKVLVIFNKNKNSSFQSFDKFEEIIPKNSKGYDVLNHTILDLKHPITLQGKSAYIIEIK